MHSTVPVDRINSNRKVYHIWSGGSMRVMCNVNLITIMEVIVYPVDRPHYLD